LQSLSKVEINELKSLKNPPEGIKLLMQGVCYVLGVEPIKSKAKDGVTIIRDFWAASIGKSILGNPKLIEILSEFDSTSITTVSTSLLISLFYRKQ